MAATVAGTRADAIRAPLALRWPRLLVAPAVVAGLALAMRVLYGGGVAGYDATYALLWGRDLIHGRLPHYESAVAPTPHPLANLVAAPISLLSDNAVYVMPVVAFVGL